MRFLIGTWGSKGDLHPFLALGKALRGRGHEVTLVGNPDWASEAAQAGVRFVEGGPRQDAEFLASIPEITSTARQGMDAFHALFGQWFGPAFDPMFRTLCREAKQHDVLIVHHAAVVGGAVAEATGAPWVTVALAPCVVPSRNSLPVSLPGKPGTGALGRTANLLQWKLSRVATFFMARRYFNEFRRRQGLPAHWSPVSHLISPQLMLGLFSEHFFPRDPVWGGNEQLAGFCLWDPPVEFTPSAGLRDFLAAGPKPWLVTLGTAMVANPRGLYEAAIEAVRGTSHRAVLLTGRGPKLNGEIPPNVHVLEYAPYGWIMPQCAAVAHQCGIGTCAQSLRAGIPTVACPYVFDQPNNARQLELLGVAAFVPLGKRSGPALRRAFESLLAGDAPRRAKEIAARLSEEDGPTRACEILERFAAR